MNKKTDLSLFENYPLHNGYITTQNEVKRLKSKYPLLFKIENKLCNKNFICGASHYIDEKIFMLKDI